MKKARVVKQMIILTMLVIPWSVYSQDTEEIPKLIVQEREYDFGKVKEGSRISHEFSVQNKGNAPLEIKRVRPG